LRCGLRVAQPCGLALRGSPPPPCAPPSGPTAARLPYAAALSATNQPPSPPGIEDLRDKREEINRQILKEDEEKAKARLRRRAAQPSPRAARVARVAGLTRPPRFALQIQNDLAVLTKRLSHLNDSIARKVASRNEYDKTISETEAAYLKILESSQTLLTVLKRETITLTKKQQPQ